MHIEIFEIEEHTSCMNLGRNLFRKISAKTKRKCGATTHIGNGVVLVNIWVAILERLEF